jgi:hypothetical protein
MNRAGCGDAVDDALRLAKSKSVHGDVSVDERPGAARAGALLLFAADFRKVLDITKGDSVDT